MCLYWLQYSKIEVHFCSWCWQSLSPPHPPTLSLHTLSICTHWIPLPTPPSWQSLATGLYTKADSSTIEQGMIPKLTYCITSDGWRAGAHTHTYTQTHVPHGSRPTTNKKQSNTTTQMSIHKHEIQPTPTHAHWHILSWWLVENMSLWISLCLHSIQNLFFHLQKKHKCYFA